MINWKQELLCSALMVLWEILSLWWLFIWETNLKLTTATAVLEWVFVYLCVFFYTCVYTCVYSFILVLLHFTLSCVLLYTTVYYSVLMCADERWCEQGNCHMCSIQKTRMDDIDNLFPPRTKKVRYIMILCVACCCVLLCTPVYSCVLLCSVVYCCVLTLKYTRVHKSIQQYTTVHNSTQEYTGVYKCRILFCSMYNVV